MGFQQGGQCGSHGGGGNRDGLRSEPHLRGPCSLSEDICIAFFYIYIYFFYIYIYLLFIYLLIYLTVPVIACGIVDLSRGIMDHELRHAGSSSLTRDQTHAPCFGSSVS